MQSLLMELILLLTGIFGKPLQDTIVDLTHPVNADTIAWPSSTPFRITGVFSGVAAGGRFWYETRDISSSEHAGTHVDAPSHIRDAQGGWTTGEIPINQLVGRGVKIDVAVQSAADIDFQLRARDILAWETEHGQIPAGAIVLVHTDRGRLYSDRDVYLGRPIGLDLPTNDTENLHFPGIGTDAAELFVARNVMGVGIDTPSLDYGQSKDFAAHRILLGANIWGIENVARTDLLPTTGFTVYNMVMNLQGGSGGPTRVIAILDR